jgi:hypothetical protein
MEVGIRQMLLASTVRTGQRELANRCKWDDLTASAAS